MVFLPTSGNSAARNPYDGDFDYAQRIRFSPGAVSEHQGSGAGPALARTTDGYGAGFAPWLLEWFGIEVVTPAENVRARSCRKNGCPRTLAAFRGCGGSLRRRGDRRGKRPERPPGDRCMPGGHGQPAWSRCPVGFVQAEESMSALCSLESAFDNGPWQKAADVAVA